MVDPADTTSEPGLESAAVGAALLAGFGIAAVLYALGVGVWWIAFPMIGGLVPLAVGLAEYYESSAERDDTATDTDETADALERLRERYAQGELTEAEFERRLERLVETESVEEAQRAVDRRQGESQRTRDIETETELKREPETE
jgi:Predicted membrane protein